MALTNAHIQVMPSDDVEVLPKKKDAGLAPLLLTVVELIRQLMEAQVIRRMESGNLSDTDLDRAADSVRKLEEQIVN
jgi:hypothetical protein